MSALKNGVKVHRSHIREVLLIPTPKIAKSRIFMANILYHLYLRHLSSYEKCIRDRISLTYQG